MTSQSCAIPAKISNEQMKQIAQTRYDSFDTTRRETEATAADADDLKMLKAAAKTISEKRVRKMSECQN